MRKDAIKYYSYTQRIEEQTTPLTQITLIVKLQAQTYKCVLPCSLCVKLKKKKKWMEIKCLLTDLWSMIIRHIYTSYNNNAKLDMVGEHFGRILVVAWCSRALCWTFSMVRNWSHKQLLFMLLYRVETIPKYTE